MFRHGLVGTFVTGAILFVYWCGGGNFERGENLAVTIGASVLLGAVASFFWSFVEEEFVQ